MPGYNGATALLIAASRDHLGIAAALVTSGADPDAESDEPLVCDVTEVEGEEPCTGRGYVTPRHLAASNPAVSCRNV